MREREEEGREGKIKGRQKGGREKDCKVALSFLSI